MDYENMKIFQLRTVCREKGIDTSTMLEKGDFVKALQKASPRRANVNGSSSNKDYENMKISELRGLCREKGIDSSNMLEKGDFVKALQKTDPSSKGPGKASSNNYDDMKVSELKSLCQGQGIDTVGMFDKKEMVDALQKRNPQSTSTANQSSYGHQTRQTTTTNQGPATNATKRTSVKPQTASPAATKPIKKASATPAANAARRASTPATTKTAATPASAATAARRASTHPATTKSPATPASTPAKSKFFPFKRSATTAAATNHSSPAAPKPAAKPRRSSGTAIPTGTKESSSATKQPTRTTLPSTPEATAKPIKKANSAPAKNKPKTAPSPNPKPKPTVPKTNADGIPLTIIAPSPDNSKHNDAMPDITHRNSTNYTGTDLEAAFKSASHNKWRTTTQQFGGSLGFRTIGEEEDKRGKPIPKALEKFHAKPHKYAALMYHTAMVTDKWPTKDHAYTFIMRKGTSQLEPKDADPKGKWTIHIHHYQHLPPFSNHKMPQTDSYTTSVLGTHKGQKLPPPLCPGRGMGVCDLPSCKIIGDVDPSDIRQGEVGDCWLLSAISAIAEFDGAIKRLFRKTKRIDDMPLDDGSVNFYTITLWDLTTWKEVDIVIDESLCASKRDPGQLLASKPSEDGELWVPYLEKALAIHCGGWDEITGGQCTHGWSLMTGCREQYLIMRDPKTKKFFCSAKINPATRQWSKHFNSPKRGTGGVWRCPWPEVGGGGDENLDLTEDELFDRMCAWDRVDFIVAAGTKGTSDKNKSGGMVDNHAYSVIDCHPRVAGTKVDLLKIRNPWGQGEIEEGDFDDDGPGWDKYPQIKAELKPVVADDGIFYLTKKEFFHFFDHIYLSAKSMTAFKED